MKTKTTHLSRDPPLTVEAIAEQKRRDAMILKMLDAGESAVAVASHFGLTANRVHGIRKRAKDREDDFMRPVRELGKLMAVSEVSCTYIVNILRLDGLPGLQKLVALQTKDTGKKVLFAEALLAAARLDPVDNDISAAIAKVETARNTSRAREIIMVPKPPRGYGRR